ncbi:Small glutamine-rich tetratricopeptide repeat-containing protein beta [Echinococcus granulosus]|uniref:Small glutamine rich tetratricopeptide n=1 Tax=Echinococcus granulosus TaxID=6210 RepID=U6J4S2_ECHGR|nr:Small glutamine-rich tetratricopeptide repeat-containing protein beta [Echinococcus granulosus]EUB62876.1 Small glutamine-rich tetratricopeptide repeat-containing protein beta [Echinococcus granulosus]KAH9280162.1 Small glutamine-rich tetratricopeptide repeat-containing protein beta [Echinococcus granulosus]CDS19003.1 small glutamine rich tetratricopeptide [Echinococcus granulosus]
MISETKRKLYQCIAAFLRNECSSNEYSSDTIESLEVAKQCIESAFDVSDNLDTDTDLLMLFARATSASKPNARQVTLEDKIKAESLKTQGNSFMVSEKFDEAIDCYSKAISLDPNNAIYYCNRAAAKSRLNKDSDCIADCEKALEIDPTYSKAYGRMGLAYCNMAKYEKAIEAYKKAISLDPNNLNFKQSLALAEANLKESSSHSSNASPNNFGGLDLGALLSNPMMQNMAQQLMSDPQMQSTVSSMMQGIFSGGTGSAEGTGVPSGGPNIDNLLRYGQQFAQQMRQTNPDLVDTLRQQMQNMTRQQPPSNDTDNEKDAAHKDL